MVASARNPSQSILNAKEEFIEETLGSSQEQEATERQATDLGKLVLGLMHL